MNDAYAKALRPRLGADLIARNDVDPVRPAWADPALSTVFAGIAPTSPLPEGSRLPLGESPQALYLPDSLVWM